MKKKRNIKISNRLSYTLIAIGIFIILGVGVYAVAGVSHSLDEIPSIPWSKLIDIPSGFADGVDNDSGCPEGYELVENNFRSQCVKDFSAVSCSITEVSDSYASVRRVNGVTQTRVHYVNICDSDWVDGHSASCGGTSGFPTSANFDDITLSGRFGYLAGTYPNLYTGYYSCSTSVD